MFQTGFRCTPRRGDFIGIFVAFASFCVSVDFQTLESHSYALLYKADHGISNIPPSPHPTLVIKPHKQLVLSTPSCLDRPESTTKLTPNNRQKSLPCGYKPRFQHDMDHSVQVLVKRSSRSPPGGYPWCVGQVCTSSEGYDSDLGNNSLKGSTGPKLICLPSEIYASAICLSKIYHQWSWAVDNGRASANNNPIRNAFFRHRTELDYMPPVDTGGLDRAIPCLSLSLVRRVLAAGNTGTQNQGIL